MVSRIEFDPQNKEILINNFPYTILNATQGNSYITVNETIESETPSTGIVAAAITGWQVRGFADLSGGYDWSTQNETFTLTSGAGGPETITLTDNCSNLSEIVSHINSKLASGTAFYPHGIYLEAYAYDTNTVAFRHKLGYEGCHHGIKLVSGSPNDALETLGMSNAHVMGASHYYNYTSWSGSQFNLDENLSQNYTQDWAVCASNLEIDVQDIYDATMDWADELISMGYSVPMRAEGKVSLVGSIYGDIYYILQDSWKIRLWDGTYDFTFKGTLVTDGGYSRTNPPNLGLIDEIFILSTYATIIESGSAVTEQDKADIADKVWDETLSEHQIVGSTGEALDDAGAAAATPAEIADAVLDEAIADHLLAGSLGEAINMIRQVTSGKLVIDPVASTITIYAADDSTILKVYDIKRLDGQPAGEGDDVYQRIPQ